VLENDLDTISAGQASLSDSQRQLISHLRARQSALDLSVA
jgi:hypothetical protein